MSQFAQIYFGPEFNVNSDNTQQITLCITCLIQNVPLISLSKCYHTGFLEKFFTLSLQGNFVCHECHAILKKIHVFKNQVEESLALFNQQAIGVPNKKLHSWKRKPIEIITTLDFESSIKIETKNDLSDDWEYGEVFTIKSEDLDSVSNRLVFGSNILDNGATILDNGANILDNGPNILDNGPNILDNKRNMSNRKVEISDENLQNGKEISLDCKMTELIKTALIPKTNRKPTRPTIEEKYVGIVKSVVITYEELIEERERERKQEGYLNLPYKCENCVLGFDHQYTLTDHLNKIHQHKKNGITCDLCKSVLSGEMSFKEHLKRHVKRYECMMCGCRKKSVQSIVKHYTQLHGCIEQTYTCECGYTTESNRRYRYHREKHIRHKCTKCDRSFVNTANLKRHMRSVHNKMPFTYKCRLCDKVYKAKSGLATHIAYGHKRPPNSYCTVCETHFQSPLTLAHHLRTHSKHITDDDKPYECNDCGAKFFNKRLLREHIVWLHLRKSQFECSKCDKIFKNKSGLKQHTAYVHEKKRPPRNKICDHCGRGFTSLSILRCHVRTHTGERPLRCVHCSADFAHSAALYNHNKLLHSGRNS